jgi:hypothetical protein
MEICKPDDLGEALVHIRDGTRCDPSPKQPLCDDAVATNGVQASGRKHPIVDRTAAARTIGKGLAELLAPAPHRFVEDDNASFSQKQLDIPQAKAEHAS